MTTRRTLLVLAAGLVAGAGAAAPTTVSLRETSLASGSVPATQATPSDDWQELFPAAQPLPRDSAEVAYDDATQSVVVSSGESSCGGSGRDVYTDTWSWDGAAWARGSTDAPPVFDLPSAYDAATQTMVVIWFAGCGEGLSISQWDGTTWTTAQDDASFPDVDGVMAYDPSTQTLLLWEPGPGSPQGDGNAPPGAGAQASGPSTWSWDGSTWTLLSPATEPPSSLGTTQDVQMVDDTATGQLLLYSDHSQQMWAWQGGDWTELPANAAPGPRVGASMVYDDALGEALLFGGCTVTGYTPPGTGGGYPTPDSYTLEQPLNDLWAWDGTGWTELSPAHSPPARLYAQMAYDDATGQVLLFGGAVDTAADIADTWVYGPTS
jgi:hypothetical protein